MLGLFRHRAESKLLLGLASVLGKTQAIDLVAVARAVFSYRPFLNGITEATALANENNGNVQIACLVVANVLGFRLQLTSQTHFTRGISTNGAL